MARRKADAPAPRTEAEAEDRKNDLEASFTEQMVKLFEQRRAMNTTIAELTKQLTQAGLSGKVIKSVARLQLETEEETEARQAFEEDRDALLARLGAFATTPLGNAAVQSATH